MSSNMARADYPLLTTSPSDLRAFDLNNRFRVQGWDERPESIRMQQKENDAKLITFLDKLPKATREWTNPIMRFSVDTRMDEHTTLALAVTAADTYISLTDPRIVKPGYAILFPDTSQQMYVEDTDEDLGEGWTNNVAAACNVKVSRTKMGGIQSAITAGTGAYSMGAVLGELSEAREGVSSTPGDPQYNYISIKALYFVMSKLQINSEMIGDWGTLPKEMKNVMHQMYMQLQRAMMFQNRTTWLDSTEKQFYLGGGLQFQLQDNVLDLGSLGVNATWPIVNDFLEPMFESSLSAMEKDAFFGPKLYRDFLNTARQMGAVNTQADGKMTYYDSDLGGDAFVVTTDSGRRITCRELKWSLAGNLADWGFILDRENLGGGFYKGYAGMQVISNIQLPSAIQQKSDAILTSWALNVFDKSTMGIIRGGTLPVINR